MKAQYLSSSDLDALRQRMFCLYDQLRPDAVGIVDSFELTDGMLDSAIGRYDGRVYEALYQSAAESALNATQVRMDARFPYQKTRIALNDTPVTEIRDVTCHLGSHGGTCYPTQVNAPRPTPSLQAGTRFTDSIYIPRRDGRLS